MRELTCLAAAAREGTLAMQIIASAKARAERV
jgi:hypothetical protein